MVDTVTRFQKVGPYKLQLRCALVPSESHLCATGFLNLTSATRLPCFFTLMVSKSRVMQQNQPRFSALFQLLIIHCHIGTLYVIILLLQLPLFLEAINLSLPRGRLCTKSKRMKRGLRAPFLD